MVRSTWKKSLIASLAWAGMAWGQQPAPVPAPSKPRTLTVREEGKAPLKCKLLNAWKTADGLRAYQVQALEGGETLTIVEVAAATAADPKAVTTRIYHWGQSTTPPPGAPVAPAHVATDSAVKPAARMSAVKQSPYQVGMAAPAVPVLPPAPAVVNNPPRAAVVSPPSAIVSRQVVGNSTPPAPVIVKTEPAPLAVPPVEPAKPGGAVVGMQATPLTPSADDKAVAKTDDKTPPAEWRKSWGKDDESAAKPDPLRMPEIYSKPSVSTMTKTEAATAKAVAPMMPSPAAPGMHAGAPLGMQSVLAAGGNPATLPVPVVTLPPMPNSVQPQQPVMVARAPTSQEMNAFTPPMSPPSQGVMPIAYSRPLTVPAAGMGLSNGSPAELVATLKDAMLPSQREWAADRLSRTDWKTHAEIVPALLAAAKDDPAPLVRTSCVRCLAKLKANTPAVLTVLECLKTDADAGVRDEATQALAKLTVKR